MNTYFKNTLIEALRFGFPEGDEESILQYVEMLTQSDSYSNLTITDYLLGYRQDWGSLSEVQRKEHLDSLSANKYRYGPSASLNFAMQQQRASNEKKD